MSDKIQRFFKKNSIRIEDVKYILREDGSTNVYLIDGRTVPTYHPIKEFRETLPVEDFLFPNKGIIASASQIVSVEGGFYRMADGRAFKYRTHNSLLHDTRLLMLGRSMERMQRTADSISTQVLQERYSILDNLPVCACVIEYFSKGYGLNASLIMRYMNDFMLKYENLSRENVIDEDFEKIYPEIDPRWIVTCADVALNGSSRSIIGYSPAHDQKVQVYAYQPMDGFCCCILIPQQETEPTVSPMLIL